MTSGAYDAQHPCRILLVDDHPIMREGLRLLIQQESRFAVQGEASTGRAALEAVTRLLPDVVVLDLGLPDMHGLDVARQILRVAPNTKLVVLSARGDTQLLDEALEVGVTAYVLKGDASQQLIEAIRMAADGKTYLCAELASLMVPRYKRLLAAGRTHAEPALSERERQVLQYLAEGHSTKEIALQLKISTKTIETHRSHLMDKLNRHNIAELTKYAIRHGITSL
jgi:two-component system, NarL family, response regulator LiaR